MSGAIRHGRSRTFLASCRPGRFFYAHRVLLHKLLL